MNLEERRNTSGDDAQCTLLMPRDSSHGVPTIWRTDYEAVGAAKTSNGHVQHRQQRSAARNKIPINYPTLSRTCGSGREAPESATCSFKWAQTSLLARTSQISGIFWSSAKALSLPGGGPVPRVPQGAPGGSGAAPGRGRTGPDRQQVVHHFHQRVPLLPFPKAPERKSKDWAAFAMKRRPGKLSCQKTLKDLKKPRKVPPPQPRQKPRRARPSRGR